MVLHVFTHKAQHDLAKFELIHSSLETCCVLGRFHDTVLFAEILLILQYILIKTSLSTIWIEWIKMRSNLTYSDLNKKHLVDINNIKPKDLTDWLPNI